VNYLVTGFPNLETAKYFHNCIYKTNHVAFRVLRDFDEEYLKEYPRIGIYTEEASYRNRIIYGKTLEVIAKEYPTISFSEYVSLFPEKFI
jgi:hypothetical protein